MQTVSLNLHFLALQIVQLVTRNMVTSPFQNLVEWVFNFSLYRNGKLFSFKPCKQKF